VGSGEGVSAGVSVGVISSAHTTGLNKLTVIHMISVAVEAFFINL
jgi:hypothetical protein